MSDGFYILDLSALVDSKTLYSVTSGMPCTSVDEAFDKLENNLELVILHRLTDILKG